MPPKLAKEITVLAGLLAFLSAFILGFQLYDFTMVEIPANENAESQLVAALGKKNQEIETLHQFINNLTSVKQELHAIDAELHRSLEGMPQEKKLPELIRSLSDIAKNTGIRVESIKPSAPLSQQVNPQAPTPTPSVAQGSPGPPSSPATIPSPPTSPNASSPAATSPVQAQQSFYLIDPLEIVIDGTYTQILTFLDELFHLRRILTLESTVFEPADTHGILNKLDSAISIHAKLTLLSYRYHG